MPKTVEKFTNERNELLQNMLNIIEISKDNNMLSLKKLEKDLDKQRQIIELESEIKKYFICSKWNYFTNKNADIKRNYISLIRSICKDMNITMRSSTLKTKIGDKVKCETFYVFDLN